MVLEQFLPAPAPPVAATDLQQVDDVYRADAYHSLSIEGYTLSEALLGRVRSGLWNPEHNEQDRLNRNALAATGRRSSASKSPWRACSPKHSTGAGIGNCSGPRWRPAS